jgi:hypothetical protein
MNRDLSSEPPGCHGIDIIHEDEQQDEQAQSASSGSPHSTLGPVTFPESMHSSPSSSGSNSWGRNSSWRLPPSFYTNYGSGTSSPRSIPSSLVHDTRCEVLANWLHAKCEAKMWTTNGDNEGVFVKKSRGEYVQCPPVIGSDLERAIFAMNVRVCYIYFNSPRDAKLDSAP